MRLAFLATASLILAGCATSITGRPTASLSDAIAGIQKFAARDGERLWPGYGAAPFGFLLIEQDHETLYCRDSIPEGFGAPVRDPATGCPSARRNRSNFPTNLLAAMPLFGPPSTIVMGTPEATGRSEAEWTRTILHEHFHQWQSALPDYYARVAALDLAGGDETGMWMLNYAFPYADPAVANAYAHASRALAAAVRARGTNGFRTALTNYREARNALAAAAGPDNWRYAEFQLWQEGLARWTEIELGKSYPNSAVRQAAKALEEETLAALDTPDLAASNRLFAYPFGTGEAMLLEACDPSWRDEYVATLALGPILGRRCFSTL